MVPPNLNFWSILSKEGPESQQNRALKTKTLLLFSNERFDPRYNQIKLNKRRTSIFDGVCCTYEQLLYPKQCTAFYICECNSKDKTGLPRVIGNLSTSAHFRFL